MEVRVSRILSEYYEYTRKESEQYLREGRVTVNGKTVGIGDKASATDNVALDGASIPLKGIFRKVQREQVNKNTAEKYSHSGVQEDEEFAENPKSNKFRKGRKNASRRPHGKNHMDDEIEIW